MSKYGNNTELKDFGMNSHMSMDDAHIKINIGKLECKEHYLHGKVIVQRITTPVLADHGGPKEYGVASEEWFLEETPDKTFKNVGEFAKHHKLP